jgi:CHASE2 domain-containing sensor protein
MKSRNILLLIFLFYTCCKPQQKEPVITIINIGSADRVALGKMVGAIKRYDPKLVAMDFYLVPDSADVDNILVQELETMTNTVQIVGLHDLDDNDIFDSLEVNHPKFKVAHHGFANFYSDMGVIVRDLPLKQTFYSQDIYAFSYVVALHSFGVKEKFREPGKGFIEFDLDDIGKNYNLIQYKDLLSGKVDRVDLEGKIVLMGFIGSNEDLLSIRGERRPFNGVEMHAALIDELIDRD